MFAFGASKVPTIILNWHNELPSLSVRRDEAKESEQGLRGRFWKPTIVGQEQELVRHRWAWIEAPSPTEEAEEEIQGHKMELHRHMLLVHRVCLCPLLCLSCFVPCNTWVSTPVYGRENQRPASWSTGDYAEEGGTFSQASCGVCAWDCHRGLGNVGGEALCSWAVSETSLGWQFWQNLHEVCSSWSNPLTFLSHIIIIISA